MTENERNWVAGLMEGEGSFTFWRRKHTLKNGAEKEYWYPRVACGMTDLDVLEHLLEVVGIGRICESLEHSRRGNQRYFIWQVSNQEQCLSLMRELQPLMGSRRQKRIGDLLDHVDKSKRGIPQDDIDVATRFSYMGSREKGRSEGHRH